MSDGRLKQLAIVGLVLAIIGLTVPGLHHVRCSPTLEGSASVTTCEETFPLWVSAAAAVVGLGGAALALGTASVFARSSRTRAARIVLALAAMALLVPTALPLAGWASAGFDLAAPTLHDDGRSFCTGTGRTPLWLTTPTCVERLAMFATPAIALAGLLALAASFRASRPLAFGALTITAIVAFAFALAIVRDEAYLSLRWAVPLMGAALVIAALPLLATRQAPSA